MTTHEKRTFTQFREEFDPFDQCVRIHSTFLPVTPIEEVIRMVRYDWLKARQYGIPEADICDHLLARTKRYFRQRGYRPRPSTFSLS